MTHIISLGSRGKTAMHPVKNLSTAVHTLRFTQLQGNNVLLPYFTLLCDNSLSNGLFVVTVTNTFCQVLKYTVNQNYLDVINFLSKFLNDKCRLAIKDNYSRSRVINLFRVA